MGNQIAMRKTSKDENMLAGLMPGGIEAQEARGQVEFGEADVFPVNMMYGCTKEKLEKLGCIFGDRPTGDEIFWQVKLPEGWIKKATEHSLWTNLLNEKGEIVCNIFYKAAFYDRNSHMWFSKEFVEKYPEYKQE